MPRSRPAFRPIRHRPPPRRDAPSTPPLLERIAVCRLPSRTGEPRCQAGTKLLLQALSQAKTNPRPSGILERRATRSSRSHLGGTLAKMAFALPAARQVHHDLPQSELLRRALAMPTARATEYGAPNVQTQVLARSKASTFIVADDPDSYPHQAIDRDEWQRVADLQNAYIADQEMIVVDGYIGDTAERRVPARLYVEAANANIAGMQDFLYFHDPEAGEFEPELLVIYTPNLAAPGYPEDRLIAVNLDLYVTRVFNSDYFGESKKGGLRMWNHLVFERGGLALHAGCKMIPTDAGVKTGLIVGLSGTGKTTTTFTRQNGSLPVQDDFVAWMADGRIYVTEDGCFANTYRPQSLGRADDLQRRHAARLVSGERVATRRRGRLLRRELHAERPRDVPVRRDRVGGRARDRRRRLPPRPEQERQRHSRRRKARGAAGSGLFHARRDEGDGCGGCGRSRQGAARARYEPVLPHAARPAGESIPRVARGPSARGLHPQHRPRRRR